ncbi:MAG: hypothetical protein K0M40_05290 [Prolixibacteraceae bacterium]|nr:hypothetical protein [Prolixibacteraceae bacterium]
MKTLVKIFFLMAFVSLIAGCNKENIMGDESSEMELKKAKLKPVTVTVPFKADFVGTYMAGTGPNSECGECPTDEDGNPIGPECWGMVYNDGEGTATHLGKITSHMEFCCEFISGIYPGNYMKAWFVAANGDKLFVACSGQVLNGRLDYHPEDVNSYFKDPFEIIGGTGKFEGATGSGWTDDYNRDSYPANSFHHWTGTITMVKGKK